MEELKVAGCFTFRPNTMDRRAIPMTSVTIQGFRDHRILIQVRNNLIRTQPRFEKA